MLHPANRFVIRLLFNYSLRTSMWVGGVYECSGFVKLFMSSWEVFSVFLCVKACAFVVREDKIYSPVVWFFSYAVDELLYGGYLH